MSNLNDDRLQTAFDAARQAAQAVPTPEQQARARAQFLLAARSVSLEVVVRHTVQTGALSEPMETSEGAKRMNYFYSKRVRWIAAALLAVIVAGGFWASPALRALAQSVIDFFTPAETDTQSGSVYIGNTDPDAPGGVYVDPFRLSLDDVVAGANFDVRLPSFMPDALHLKGALLSDDRERVEMIYECTAPWSLLIAQWHVDQSMPLLEVGASAVIEDVPIRDEVAQYVRGMWRYEVDPETMAQQSDKVGEVPATRVWTNDSPWQWLAWREDGINFTITTAGFDMNAPLDEPNPCLLTKADYVAIAQGLQPASLLK